MLPDAHAKSFLSKSYVNAIAAQAGYGCQFVEPDYGIDATVSEIQVVPNGKYVNSGCQFNIQIKASYDYTKKNDEIVYELSADAYDRFLYHSEGLLILVLFCVPMDANSRVIQSEECLELRNCCYWYSVNSSDRKTLHIPRAQVFDASSCRALMALAKRRDWQK